MAMTRERLPYVRPHPERPRVGPDEEPSCQLCDKNPSDAMWMAGHDLWICSECAVETLPKLIADAVLNRQRAPKHDLPVANRTLDRVYAEFWRAWGLAQWRQRNNDDT